MQSPELGDPPAIEPLREGNGAAVLVGDDPDVQRLGHAGKGPALGPGPGSGGRGGCRSPWSMTARPMARPSGSSSGWRRAGSSSTGNPETSAWRRNWNRCIAHARGHWLHLLHQDDVVLPGFYERMGPASRERPDVGGGILSACLHRRRWRLGAPFGDRATQCGRPGRMARQDLAQQRIQCALIVVRRGRYTRNSADTASTWPWPSTGRCGYGSRPLSGLVSSQSCSPAGESTTRTNRVGCIERAPTSPTFSEQSRSFVATCPRNQWGAASFGLSRLFHKKAELMQAGDRKAGLAMFDLACECDPTLKSSKTHFAFRKRGLGCGCGTFFPSLVVLQ